MSLLLAATGVTIVCEPVDPTDGLGTPSVIFTQFVSPELVDPTDGLGTPIVVLPLQPTGIASGEGFGPVYIVPPAALLGLTPIASGEAFGTCRVWIAEYAQVCSVETARTITATVETSRTVAFTATTSRTEPLTSETCRTLPLSAVSARTLALAVETQ